MHQSKEMARIAWNALSDKKVKISRSLISQEFQCWQTTLSLPTETVTAR